MKKSITKNRIWLRKLAMKTNYYVNLAKQFTSIVLPKLLGLTFLLLNFQRSIMSENYVKFKLSECEVFRIKQWESANLNNFINN